MVINRKSYELLKISICLNQRLSGHPPATPCVFFPLLPQGSRWGKGDYRSETHFLNSSALNVFKTRDGSNLAFRAIITPYRMSSIPSTECASGLMEVIRPTSFALLP